MDKKSNVESTISKKNKKIKEANVSITGYFKENNEQIIEITVNQLIEPYMRPRKTKGRIYDPLSNYKKILKNKIENALKKNSIEVEIGEDKYIQVHIIALKEIPSSYSKKKKLLAFEQKYKNNKKPDVDNIAKTIYDSVEGLLFFNDSQICLETFEKRYDMSDRTIINFMIKNQPDTKGTLNKNELKKYNNLVKEGLLK